MIGRLAAGARLALDVLLPPVCITCDTPVDAPGQLCAECFKATSFITDPRCDACGIPFARQVPAGGRCRACREHPPPWERARAPLRYDAQGRAMVLPLKYGDRIERAAALAPLMRRAGAVLLDEADLIVPVPLHRLRLLSRKFNQAALLARHLARLAGVPVLVDGLVRTRRTRPLAELSAAARTAMLAGAIAVRPRHAARFAGLRVLLVDDVLTSGATARACTRALLGAGAGAVDVLVAARVGGEDREEALLF